MGMYCVGAENIVPAVAGEYLRVKRLTHTTAIVNLLDQVVCIPHEGTLLHLDYVPPSFAENPMLLQLERGMIVPYEIENVGSRYERDVITLPDGSAVDLADLLGCILRIHLHPEDVGPIRVTAEDRQVIPSGIGQLVTAGSAMALIAAQLLI